MTRGNSRIPERSFSEGPELMEFQKPEALNLTNISLYNGGFANKAIWTKGSAL